MIELRKAFTFYRLGGYVLAVTRKGYVSYAVRRDDKTGSKLCPYRWQERSFTWERCAGCYRPQVFGSLLLEGKVAFGRT